MFSCTTMLKATLLSVAKTWSNIKVFVANPRTYARYGLCAYPLFTLDKLQCRMNIPYTRTTVRYEASKSSC
jgi:hypothetical protein